MKSKFLTGGDLPHLLAHFGHGKLWPEWQLHHRCSRITLSATCIFKFFGAITSTVVYHLQFSGSGSVLGGFLIITLSSANMSAYV